MVCIFCWLIDGRKIHGVGGPDLVRGHGHGQIELIVLSIVLVHLHLFEVVLHPQHQYEQLEHTLRNLQWMKDRGIH